MGNITLNVDGIVDFILRDVVEFNDNSTQGNEEAIGASSIIFIGEAITINRILGTTTNIFQDAYQGVLFGNERTVRVGDFYIRTFVELMVKVGFNLLGRIISPISIFLDI